MSLKINYEFEDNFIFKIIYSIGISKKTHFELKFTKTRTRQIEQNLLDSSSELIGESCHVVGTKLSI